MTKKHLLLAFMMATAPTTVSFADERTRIFVVSSYHAEYLWSQSTQQGLCEAMLQFGYLDNGDQIDEFTRTDSVMSSTAVVKKEWMDTKRKNTTSDIAAATVRITASIDRFRPDVVLLGDDNAANYIGNQLLDAEVPVVFWGINGLPLKYGLLDRLGRPGHNVTGVWQSGYQKESLELLHELVPEARTFAILACDSETSRPKVKQLQVQARQGVLPLQLVEVVVTNSYSEFQRRALELAARVDAFFVLNHDTMKDDQGNHVDMMTVGKWYLEHIDKPETSHEGQFVREGMLCTANDSGYNQGFEALTMAAQILQDGLDPATMRPRTPGRGPLMMNVQRARMLRIGFEAKLDQIDELAHEALALQ